MKMGIWTRALNRQSIPSRFNTYPKESAYGRGGALFCLQFSKVKGQQILVKMSWWSTVVHLTAGKWKSGKEEDQGLRTLFKGIHPFKDLELPKAPPLGVPTVSHCWEVGDYTSSTEALGSHLGFKL